VEDLKLTPYVVRRDADRWVFVPSSTFVGLATGGFGAMSAFLVYLSTLFFRRTVTAPANSLFGPVLLLAAIYCAGLGIYTWRTRRTPLSVEFGGRISYGNWELCAAGTVRAVRLAESRGGEAGDCEVGLEVEGKTVFIPPWYFARFKSREHARPFAAKLAEVLEVQVTESR
jgi:hypothetical protein